VIDRQREADAWSYHIGELEDWVESQRGRVTDSHAAPSFDHALFEVELQDLRLRLVRDRGDYLIDVWSGGRWHSLKNVIAFRLGMRPGAAANWTGLKLGDYFEAWQGALSALKDPGLAAYEDAIGLEILHGIRERGLAMRDAVEPSGQPDPLVRLQ
jgi:hypothetical protein